MALTLELLKGNAATAALTEEQMSAVVEMSKNDEAAVIGQKTGEIYGGLDADVLAASGIPKNGIEKTYDYAKRVIGEIKQQADEAGTLRQQVGSLTKEKERLEKVIADGGADAEVKKELARAKADLANVTKDYTELKSKFDTSEENHAKALFEVKVDGEIAKAVGGIKFKADLPQSVTSVLMQQAIAKVKGMNPEYIDDGNGGKVLAFNKDGATMRNPENNLRPFTAAELIAKELGAMGVLDGGRKQTGTGGTDVHNNTGNAVLDLSGARTQSEAHDIITKQLLAQGKVNGSKEFDDELKKIWKDNLETIKALPVR